MDGWRWLVVMLVVGCAGAGWGQTRAAQTTAAAPPVGSNTAVPAWSVDAVFARRAIRSCVGEIAAAKLAAERGQSEAVRGFAGQLVQEHGQLLGELKAVAAGNGIAFEEAASPLAVRLETRLAGLQGAAFDRAFAHGMMRQHKEDVREYGMEAERGRREAERALAMRALPGLRAHLATAEELAR